MSDINGNCNRCGKPTESSMKFCLHCSNILVGNPLEYSPQGIIFERDEALKRIKQLEAENAKLKEEKAELFEKFDKLDWQSAEKLPTEEGEYEIAEVGTNGYWCLRYNEELCQANFNLEACLLSLKNNPEPLWWKLFWRKITLPEVK
jgi:hypothetical protein